jgi:hypothetical protein
LSILVFRLEVAASDGHDALVGSVLYVTGHGGPFGDTFDMVGHDLSMLVAHLSKRDARNTKGTRGTPE